MKHELNILGYDGNCLAIFFELLHAARFDGSVSVITNDEIRRSDYPFNTTVDYRVIDAATLTRPPSGGLLLGSLIANTKRFLYDYYRDRWDLTRRQFVSLRHDTAVVASTVVHGEGLIIEPLSAIAPHTTLGFATSVSRNCSIGHHCRLGDFSTLNPGVNACGHVKIGEGVTVGPGATVFHGVEIGDHSVIAGGSVVRKNIPPNVLASGNPCRAVKELDRV